MTAVLKSVLNKIDTFYIRIFLKAFDESKST